MKKVSGYLYLVLSLAIFAVCFACVGDNKSSSEEVVDSISAPAIVEADIKKNTFWTYDAAADTMIRNSIPADITIDLVLDTLNNRYGNTKLKLEKAVADTLFVKIDDLSFLQQYGSAGNYGFLAEVVFSLTEIPNVSYVFLDFEEVDHAAPGLYTRKDFDNKIIP